jgi:HEAT repeat protein
MDIEEMKRKKDVEGLIKALKDKNSNVRKKAEAALVEIGKPAVKPLIEALKEENFLVLDCAVEALGKIGDAKAVKPLIEVIYRIMDPSLKFNIYGFDMVLTKAAEALGKIGEPAVKPLIEALKHERTKWYAAEALVKIGDARAVKPLLQALKFYITDAPRMLAKIGKPAVIPLMQALKDKDEDVRKAAEAALKKIRAKES